MREIALGISSVLQHSTTPEPLSIDLWNEPPDEAAALVKALLAECHDAEIAVATIKVPKEVWAVLAPEAERMVRPLSTRVEILPSMDQQIEVWRRPPPQNRDNSGPQT